MRFNGSGLKHPSKRLLWFWPCAPPQILLDHLLGTSQAMCPLGSRQQWSGHGAQSARIAAHAEEMPKFTWPLENLPKALSKGMICYCGYMDFLYLDISQ